MPGWPSASNPTRSASGCPESPRGMPETPVPLGAVNGLLLRVIKVELKINSPLQRSVVMPQPPAAAIVSELFSEKHWIEVEVEGGHHLGSSGTQALWAAPSLGMSPAWHCSPLTAHMSQVPLWSGPAGVRQLRPPPSLASPSCAVPDLLASPGSHGQGQP